MTPDKTPGNPDQRAALAAQLNQELLHMRDSLVRLSLCLKDWQFELIQRDAATQQLAKQALEKFRIQHSPSEEANASDQSPAVHLSTEFVELSGSQKQQGTRNERQ